MNGLFEYIKCRSGIWMGYRNILNAGLVYEWVIWIYLMEFWILISANLANAIMSDVHRNDTGYTPQWHGMYTGITWDVHRNDTGCTPPLLKIKAGAPVRSGRLGQRW